EPASGPNGAVPAATSPSSSGLTPRNGGTSTTATIIVTGISAATPAAGPSHADVAPAPTRYAPTSWAHTSASSTNGSARPRPRSRTGEAAANPTATAGARVWPTSRNGRPRRSRDAATSAATTVAGDRKSV